MEFKEKTNGILEALQIKPEEARRTGLLFVYLFLASVVFMTGRTARDALFLSSYPNASKYLPHMFIGYGIASALIAPFYSYLNDKFHRDRFNMTFAFLLSLTYIVAWFFVRQHWNPIYPSLYIWVEITNNLLIVQFWTLANDMHDPREAKRLFGIIGSSRMIGIALCGLAVSALVVKIGTPSLLLVNAAALIAISFLVGVIGRDYMKTSEVARVISAIPEKSPATASIWKSTYVTLIVAMIIATFVATTIGDYQFKIIAKQHYEGEKLAAFFAMFYCVVGVLAFFFHFFGSARILARFGVIFGLLLMPVMVGGSATWLILSSGALLAAASLKLSDLAFQFTINDSSLNMLYYPFPSRMKARIKASLEGAIKPVSYGIGGVVLIFIATRLGPVKLSYLTLPIIVVWIAVLFVLRGHYVKALLSSLAGRRIEPGDESIIASPEVIAELSHAAHSENDYLFDFAVSELVKIDKDEARKVLEDLVTNPKRRYASLLKLAALGTSEEIVRPYLQDLDVKVRAAAIWTLASVREEDAVEELLPLLKSSEQRIADATCAALICFAGLDGVLVAGEYLRKLLDGDDSARMRAARILGRADIPDFFRHVKRLLKDNSIEVRKEALRAAGALKEVKLLDDLIASVGHQHLRPLAIDAIGNYGDRALEKLTKALIDEKIPLDIRERIPRLIRKINRPEAVTALWNHADNPNERLRIPILHHGERLQEKWSLSISHNRVRELLNLEGLTATKWLQRWKNLRPLAQDKLLDEVIDQSLYWCGRRVFSLLRFLYGPGDIGRIRYNLESGISSLRASALEALDNLLTQDERAWIVPLMDVANRSKAAITLSIRFPDGRETVEATIKNLLFDSLCNGRICDNYYYLTAVILRAKIKAGERLSIEEISTLARYAEGLLAEELREAMFKLGYNIDDVEKAIGGATNEFSPQALTFLKGFRDYRDNLKAKANEELHMLTNIEIVIFLKKVPLFAGVPGEDLARLAKETTLETRASGKDVFLKGDPGDAMYLIVEGKVSVHLEGKELIELGPEDFFGEMALLDREPRSATVTAVEQLTLLKITREDFLEILADRPEIARGTLEVLSRRLRKADEEIRKLSSSSASK